MVMELNRSKFINDMLDFRSTQFTISGLDLIFDFIKDYEEEFDITIKYDPIAICSSFVEFDTISDVKKYLGDDCIDECVLLRTGKSYILVEGELL